MNDRYNPPNNPWLGPRRPLTPQEREWLLRQQTADAASPPRSPAPDRREPERAPQPAPEDPALVRRVADLEAEVADLRKRLDEATALGDERLVQVQRLRADHLNYRRRIEGERAEERRQASSMLVIKLLPVLDDLERALETAGPQLAGLNWVQGIGHILRKLRAALESEGLTTIEADGERFDPTRHEGVLREETDDGNVGRVTAVLQPGYTLGGRVIRPAMVKVGVARATPFRMIDEDKGRGD